MTNFLFGLKDLLPVFKVVQLHRAELMSRGETSAVGRKRGTPAASFRFKLHYILTRAHVKYRYCLAFVLDVGQTLPIRGESWNEVAPISSVRDGFAGKLA